MATKRKTILTFLDTFRSVTNPLSPNTVEMGLLSTQHISKLASVYGVQLRSTSHEGEFGEGTCVGHVRARHVVALSHAAVVGFLQPLFVRFFRPVRVIRIVFNRFVVNRVCVIILIWFVILVHYVKRNYVNAKTKQEQDPLFTKGTKSEKKKINIETRNFLPCLNIVAHKKVLLRAPRDVPPAA